MTALRTGAATDVGRVRTNNEDQLLVAETLFAVADGMGGHAAGEVASQAAIELVEDKFRSDPTADGLIAATQHANREIYAQADSDSALRGMGTTLTAAALVDKGGGESLLVVVNVGDSRAYLLRDGELARVTDDHSVSEELVRSGQLSEEDAATDNRRHVLTRVLGMESEVAVDRFDLDPFRGDRLLLATDGLTNEVPDAEIASVLRRIEDPGEAARELVRRAKSAGGSDNITVVIVDVLDDEGRVAEATEALAREPVRPRGLPTSAQRDAKLPRPRHRPAHRERDRQSAGVRSAEAAPADRACEPLRFGDHPAPRARRRRGVLHPAQLVFRRRQGGQRRALPGSPRRVDRLRPEGRAQHRHRAGRPRRCHP